IPEPGERSPPRRADRDRRYGFAWVRDTTRRRAVDSPTHLGPFRPLDSLPLRRLVAVGRLRGPLRGAPGAVPRVPDVPELRQLLRAAVGARVVGRPEAG